MNTKVLLATVVGGIVYFLLGWLVYGMLLADILVTPESVIKPFVMWSMIVSCLIWALLLTVICSRWAGVKTYMGGATVGLIVGSLVSATVDFGMFSMYNFVTIRDSLIDIVTNGIMSAITGGIIGWLLGTGSKSN